MQSGENKKRCVIILLGPPGSGKGTQAKKVSATKKLPHISTGDLFRYNINHNTPLGCQAKTFINAGKLVPDDIVLHMLFERIAEDDCKNGCLLDGFPRTIPQAEALQKRLSSDTELFIINLDVSDDVIVKRISGRLSCSRCGYVQNLYFTPPKETDLCDKCGGDLYQREDDKPEVVSERLKEYSNLTAPLIDYYGSKNLLNTINGACDSKVVFSQIMQLLNHS